jgi:deoxyribonuclease V
MSIVVTDVSYTETHAMAACVEIAAWGDAIPLAEHCIRITPVEAYVPGQFYRRELPCLIGVLGCVTNALDVIVIDGYVWLDSHGKPGLGAHLYDSFAQRIPVIGVAKTRFAGATATPLVRGESHSPLYVTAAGIAQDRAVECIAAMHGKYRIPTIVKRVDRLSRDGRKSTG